MSSDVPIVDPWAAPKTPKKRRRIGGKTRAFLAAVALLVVPLPIAWLTVLHRSSFAQLPHAVANLFSKNAGGDDGSDKPTPARDEVERKPNPGEPDTVRAPLNIPHDRRDAAGAVPKETTSQRVGNLTIVTIGTSEPTLRQALIEQSQKAKANGKELLVMLRDTVCNPCDGVTKSLSNDLMQKALEPVVLVVIDKEVFKDDLKSLKAQFAKTPNFLLLSSDMSPRDQIDGGEWGDDIAENIAPVIGPFVRGHLSARKHKWKPEEAGGVLL